LGEKERISAGAIVERFGKPRVCRLGAGRWRFDRILIES